MTGTPQDESVAERFKVANLVLAGVGKAGTTSLFAYLDQHPDIASSTVKETRFFLSMSENQPDATGILPPIIDYARFFERASGQRYLMEATPHYFHGGATLVRALLNVSPSARIVLTLREPVDRLLSIYRFSKSMLQIPKDMSIDQFVSRARQVYLEGEPQSVENRPYWTSISGSMYSVFTRPWLELVPRRQLRVVFFDDLVASPQAVTRGLCDWLAIDTEVDDYSYDVQNRSVGFRNRRLHQAALLMNHERILRNHRRIKRPLRAVYYRVNGRKEAAAMSDQLAHELEMCFSHAKRELAQQLRVSQGVKLPSWLSEGDARP